MSVHEHYDLPLTKMTSHSTPKPRENRCDKRGTVVFVSKIVTSHRRGQHVRPPAAGPQRHNSPFNAFWFFILPSDGPSNNHTNACDRPFAVFLNSNPKRTRPGFAKAPVSPPQCYNYTTHTNHQRLRGAHAFSSAFLYPFPSSYSSSCPSAARAACPPAAQT